MKKTIFNGNDLRKEFVDYERDYYSIDGYEALLNFYDEIDEDMEVDVIAICCECTEYSNYATCNLDTLIGNYGYLYTKEEYLSENDLTAEEFNQEDYIIELITRIEHRTTVLKLKNGGYIIFSF